MDLSNLSKTEQETLIQEITNRMKDIVYSNAQNNAKKFVEQIKEVQIEDPNDTFSITYKITFTYNDLRQITGGIRRSK